MSDELDWLEAEGVGTIYTYTVSQQLSGWPEDTLPVVFAVVELEEGPRMKTNVVDTQPDTVAVGDSVEVDFVPSEEEDIGIPVFKPAD
jgi:uncharacterized OB-fold protein